jgi:hypothetical protein
VTDVAVYRATGAGVAAAVAAREAGATVALVEPTDHIGGMVSGGLSWTDVGDERVLHGFARRFYDAATYFPEPHTAEAILAGMLDGVDVVGEMPDAAVYVDASYEGDLLAERGVPFAAGRESRALYGERWAGTQPAYRPSKHNFDAVISPLADDGTLLPHVQDDTGDEVGAGDGALMAYQFRVCLTHRDPIPFEEPDGYDPAEFELLDRWRAARPERELMGLVPDLLPNGKCDVNSIGPFSLNVLDGSNRDYLEGDRDAVRSHHLEYTKRFLFHVAPEGWGLCADEFTDTGGWPHQLYVREGRRMLGEYVLTEHDLLEARPHDDAVAFGSYNIDIREVRRTWRTLPEFTPTPATFNEGYLSVPVRPYGIPYRCLTPRRDDATNLLVPVGLSASHVAYSSVRMEPTWMMLGHAAGAAAALAARAGIPVQDVDVARLQEVLAL